MRILIVGAAGVLGRATLPHLGGHDVTGTTRSADRRASLAALGARAELCDVYEEGALARVARACAPDVVVNFLTDLAGGPGPANSRIRREGGPIVSAAAQAGGARRLVVESIAFAGSADSAGAVAALEDSAVASGLDVLILRFGRFWGPGTWTETTPEPPAIHVAEAGRRAATLILAGRPGIHVVAEPNPEGTGP
ncbi:MAG TPA: NAD-dependent epimerase/dehydratase family protein [Polyangia bacterium]|nr:NAD-dependent epimerase/dehydratase family protein [Polyangia bacterium]